MGFRGGEATRLEFAPQERFPGFEAVYQQAEKQRSWKLDSEPSKDFSENKKKKGFWKKFFCRFSREKKAPVSAPAEEVLAEREEVDGRRIIARPYW